MREIKLRYLHDKKWHYITLDGSENLRVAFEKWENIGKTTKFEQFTGLKDKDGKDIYEGDIIQDMGMYHAFKVFWDNENAQFVWSKNHIDDFAESCVNCEIIGNIEENPELLK